jgi:protein-tyrosine kinase
MSAEATEGKVVSLVSRVRDALIAMGSLTPEGAVRIDEVMRTEGLGFGDAAVQLGLITPQELAQAAQAARQLPQAPDGIARGRLTAEVAVRIAEVMRTTGLGFGDAAIQLGLITPQELAEAARAAEQPPPEAPDGIFEGALHRMTSSRGLPVKYVGMVKAGPSLILARDPDNTYSEKIRALRTELMLLNAAASRSGNLIVILSPCQGEGRTQLSAELAVAFSQLGQRTLLVDADLRRPRIHALFESDNNFGLGQALASGGVPHLVGVEKLPHLSLLTAGPGVPNPLELLTNGHFQRQTTDWRKKYSMIIIDTPPITEFADGLAIASFAEQVVVVGRSGSTPQKNMKEMLRRMGGTQSRIVGAVINSF